MFNKIHQKTINIKEELKRIKKLTTNKRIQNIVNAIFKEYQEELKTLKTKEDLTMYTEYLIEVIMRNRVLAEKEFCKTKELTKYKTDYIKIKNTFKSLIGLITGEIQ